jgi:hypothetical protein
VIIMSDVRNQLQTLTGAEIVASQLSTVGGKVFTNAQDAQVDVQALTSFWRAIHVPTYGQPIPGSATTASGTGDSPILAPVTNQTALVVGLSLTNADLATPAEVSVEIDGVIIAQVSVAPGSSSVVIGAGAEAMPSLMLAEGHTLSQTVSGVAAGDVGFNVAYALVVQG